MRYDLPMRLLLCFLLLLSPRLALAVLGTSATMQAGEVKILATGPVQNGQVPLALDFTLQPGWHIYWKDPGDIGFPPRVSAVPPVVVSPLTFPPPQTLVQDGLKSRVLTGHVVLPFTAAHITGDEVHIKASWLACASQCVPGQADFTLKLSGAQAASAATLPLWLLALLGGLILNLMPCVFPVLAMKAVTFARLGGAAHGHIRREALGYTLGVIASMLALGGVLLGVRAAGQAAFWGFQFHTPAFVIVMAWILLAVGLNFVGLLHVSTPGFVQRLPAQSSFLTGLLAVLVAAPCTAPFMGAAIAAALALPVLPALGLFLALGLGMALPILLLGFIPRLAAALPRPGPWMLWVQRVLALPMLASCIWLGWVLFHQSGLPGVVILLLGSLGVVGVALMRRPAWGLAVLALLPFLHLAPTHSQLLPPGAQPYTATTLAALQAHNAPVFIDLTADWCITCQINERTTLASHAVRTLFQAHNVTLLVGDWTERDPAITALLRRYHHAGVPLYLYYPPDGQALILPQILTPKIVEAAVFGQGG